jgi:poly(3-hydroxybutyrate) depolymerase
MKPAIQRSVRALALMFACAVLAGGQAVTRETAGTITHAGQERAYRVYVPPSYDGTKHDRPGEVQ